MRRYASICVAASLVAALVACMAQADGWAVPEADVRIPLTMDGDLYARLDATIEAEIDFNALLGAERTPVAGSLRLVEPATGAETALDLAQDAGIRYTSGSPVLRLRWGVAALDPFEARRWDLYLRTTAPGAEDAWEPLEQTFARQVAGPLLETSFEESDPQHADRPRWYIAGGNDQDGETTERIWGDAGARTGSRCLKIARTFEGEPPANSNRPHWRTWPPPIAVTGGQALRLCGWLKAPRLEPGAVASISLDFYGAENNRLNDGRVRLVGGRMAHDWVFVSGATTAPLDAASACVWFSLHGSGEAYCDDVGVTAIAGASLPPVEVAVGEVEQRPDATVALSAQGKLLRCGVADTPPELDGVLDDECWAAAPAVDDFVPFMKVPGTDVNTTVRACADESAIYFGFECTEPDTAELVSTAEGRDGRVWADDSIELFLDTNRDQKTFYQIIVNPAGTVFDQDTGTEGVAGAGWDGPVDVGTIILGDKWCAEVRLGFEGLRLAEADGSRWGVNFARTSLRGGRSCYTWARVTEGFGEPTHFGTMLLPFDPTLQSVSARVLNGDTLFWGPGQLRIEVNNCRPAAVDVRVLATRVAEVGESLISETPEIVEARSSKVVALDAVIQEPGPIKVRYDVIEARTGTVLYTSTEANRIPNPLDVSLTAAVSYLVEPAVLVEWRLGVSEKYLGEYRVALDVRDAHGKQLFGSETQIVPKAITGSSPMPVAALPVGQYQLGASLLHGRNTLARSQVRFERIAGPFADTAR